jgi:hypothetical protein
MKLVSMKRMLCLLLTLSLLIPGSFAQEQIITPLPDLIISEISLDSSNHIVFTASNIGKGGLPKGWIAVAEVMANQTSMGFISLTAPTSIKDGGLETPGGSAYYLTSLILTKDASVSVIADATQSIAEASEQNNILTVQLFPKTTPPPMDLPDLVVSRIRLSDGNVAFTVTNIGKGPMPKGWSASAEVYLDGLSEVTVSLNNPSSIENGGLETAGGSANYQTNLAIKETTAVKVLADSTQAIAESDEQNNSNLKELSPQPDPPGSDPVPVPEPIEPPAADLPDLKVAGVTTAAGNRLAIMIQNSGKADTPAGIGALAEIWLGGQRLGLIDLGKPTESFFGGIGAAGGFSSYLLDYVLTAPAAIAVLVDSTSLIEESDEQNNRFDGTVTLRAPAEKEVGEPEVTLDFAIGKASYLSNGKTMPMDVAPAITESRTFMPVKYVAEAVGSKVLWDPVKWKVTVIKGLKTIELWIGGNIARINGATVYIDPENPKVVPFIANSRTYMPLRFVSEVLGGKVTWNPATWGILIDFSAAAIDDDITWQSIDSQGRVTIDDDITWHRFEMGILAIDDDITWMTDGRALRHVAIIRDAVYEPSAVVDPEPPHRPTEMIDPEPTHRPTEMMDPDPPH